VEFLVTIEIAPTEPRARAELLAMVPAEREAGRRLREQGVISRIWRLPGKWASMMLVVADDSDHLHGALSTLPLLPYSQVRVTPLSLHPIEEATILPSRNREETP
jgi:muconolactone D-isomerase